MIKKKAKISMYGTSLALFIPRSIYEDSSYPFKRKGEEKPELPINVIIKIDDGRLVIEKAPKEKED